MRTPKSLYDEITAYIVSGFDTSDVTSDNRNGDTRTITGTVKYDFTADFVLQYQTAENKLTLLLTSKEPNNDSTATLVYTMPDESTVQTVETWNNKETGTNTYHADECDGVSLGMTHVHLILAFIERLS